MGYFGEPDNEDLFARDPEPLVDYNEMKHLETVKKGEIELYENEYHLIEGSLNLPLKFMQLTEIEQKMVLLFIDKDFIEQNSGKHTENDAFISFLAAYSNRKVIEKLYYSKEVVVGYDRDGEPKVEEQIVINPEQLPLYLKMKKHATMLWKTNNLKEISKTMREIVTNNGYRDVELLEEKIISDALSDNRDNFTIQNRRIAIDIKGMKKPTGAQTINVFLKGGGQESNKAIVSSTGNQVFDLYPEVERVEE